MKYKITMAFILLFVVLAWGLIGWGGFVLIAKIHGGSSIATTESQVKTLSHRQEVWISALEWCESRGVVDAINEKDRDGTPSYYSFQFKPDTFRNFGEKYWVIEEGLPEEELMEAMKPTATQRSIVARMITDPDVNMANQFPDCIKYKVGMPPKD